MANLPTKSYLTSSGTTEAQFQSAIGQLYDFLGQGFQSSGVESLTIASGVVTPTKACIMLSAETGSVDDLTLITPTNLGEKVILVKALHTITLKHNQSGAGKLFLQGAVDLVLDNTNYTIALLYDSSTQRWNEVWRSFGIVCPSASAQTQARNALGLGSAAYQASTAFATAAQGAKADTALQPGDATPGVMTANVVTFISSGTYTKPANLLFVIVEIVGGGGGGGGALYDNAIGGSGGAGGYSRKTIMASSLGTTEIVTIGVGGTAGTYLANGGTGGTTSFGGHCSATGGVGGVKSTGTIQFQVGGNGGAATGGDLNDSGGNGETGFVISSVSFSGNGGSSKFGGAGNGVYKGYSGNAARANSGSGGSGGVSSSSSGGTGGAGGSGVIIITEFLGE